jgi:hypothetical protein
MEALIKFAWLTLAAIHVLPALVAVVPQMVLRLYDVDPHGPVGILLVHRGFLFLAIVTAALIAVFDPGVRRVCAAIVAISVIGFLVVYAQAGMPTGALRTVALVDAAALVPLVLVTVAAWRPQVAA